MAQKNHTTNLTELLLQCVAQPDPMLSMLEWLCAQLMEAEVSQQLGAEKSERAESRSEVSLWLPASQTGYPHGHHVSHGAEGTSGRLHTVLCYGAQTQ